MTDTNTAIGAELITAAQAVVDRWDTPLWKDVPATAEYIGRLRAALASAAAPAEQPVYAHARNAIMDAAYAFRDAHISGCADKKRFAQAALECAVGQVMSTLTASRGQAPADPDGEAFRTAAQLGLTLRFYGSCAQSSMPGTPSAYEVVDGADRAVAMREAVQLAAAAIENGGEPQRLGGPTAQPAPEPSALEDAARWQALPAFFEEYQIDAMKLYRDIDAYLDAARKQGANHD